MMASLATKVRLLLAIAGLMLVLQLANSLSGYSLNQWGLVPRQPSALAGILLSPWLHGSWGHLLGNLMGLAILGGLLLLRCRRDFWLASGAIVLGSGLLVWLLGRPGIHVGASGWLFGLWALLLGRAWFHRQLTDLLLAALVLFFYGGWIIGLLPSQPGISFEYHLAGALCGGGYAAFGPRPGISGRQRQQPG